MSWTNEPGHYHNSQEDENSLNEKVFVSYIRYIHPSVAKFKFWNGTEV